MSDNINKHYFHSYDIKLSVWCNNRDRVFNTFKEVAIELGYSVAPVFKSGGDFDSVLIGDSPLTEFETVLELTIDRIKEEKGYVNVV